MENFDINKIKSLLSKPKKIVIVPHRNPDGDAMGSTLGLYHFLLKLNHHVVVISPNEFPDFLNWMPAAEKVLIYEKQKTEAKSLINEAEIIFTLDFNALYRVGEMENALQSADCTFVMIDHHEKPDNFAEFTYSNTDFGSTCEMVYNLISYLDHIPLIDKTIGTCLYTGILTDSGSFKYPKTTVKTHRIVAELIDLGVENSLIPNLLFDNYSYNRLQLLGRALQNMKVLEKYHTSYIALSQAELDQFKHVKGDTEGIVNYGLTIKGIEFAAIFIENKEENIIKISFRSQGNFDVNQFAREHFNGGGHLNAAGGKSELSLQDTITKFEKIITQNHNLNEKI